MALAPKNAIIFTESLTQGHKQVVPMTSLANHLSVVSSMSPHQGQVQGQIPGQQQQAVASSMCSLPQDPQQQVGVNRRATATPPMPPKRGTTQTNNTSNNQPMAQQTSINATTGGLGVATLPPNHTQPGQQQQQARPINFPTNLKYLFYISMKTASMRESEFEKLGNIFTMTAELVLQRKYSD